MDSSLLSILSNPNLLHSAAFHISPGPTQAPRLSASSTGTVCDSMEKAIRWSCIGVPCSRGVWSGIAFHTISKNLMTPR
jgi:hypothetical protein